MKTVEITNLEMNKPTPFDDYYHFKTYKEEVKAFKAAAGDLGPEYMRQAMRQITRQLTNETQEQKVS